MPTHQNMRLALVSQYDALALPEYRPPRDNTDGDDHSAREVDVYVPVYAGSQFWTRYSCRAPPEDSETKFFYFKLYIAGKFTVAWGCGAEDEWKGKTIFVPDKSRSGDDSKEPRAKLGLFFPGIVGTRMAGGEPTLEIRVYRAKARKREERQYVSQDLGEEARDNEAVEFRTIGLVKTEEPKRFYLYALLDPAETPYAVFRYHCRTFDEMYSQGMIPPGLSMPEKQGSVTQKLRVSQSTTSATGSEEAESGMLEEFDQDDTVLE